MTLLRMWPEWVEDGACVTGETDPEIFFTPGTLAISQAKDICIECPVMFKCLAYAIKTNARDGIYGGMTPRERQEWVENRDAT